MKKRSTVRLVSYCLAALACMGGLWYQSAVKARTYERYVEASWRRAFSALASDLSQIDTALQKCRWAASPMLCGSACAEVSARSQSAQASLGELPLSDYLLEDTAGFLGRLGDYARCLARDAYAGSLNQDQRQSLGQLGDAAGELNQRLTQLQSDLDEGLVTLGALEAADQAARTGQTLLGKSLTELEDQFPELPTLIYDGPYSHSVADGPPRLLEGLDNITEAEAVRIAARFTGQAETAFTVLGRAEGLLPCYVLTTGDGAGECTLRVTQQGGAVLDMVCAAASLDEKLSQPEAAEAARAFLAAQGLDHMKDSYWTKEEGSILLNFAYSQGDVVCYPDLVKVRVCLETGKVLGFDAAGYIMSHYEREIPAAIDRETALSAVSPELTILSDGLAVIPTEGKQERYCREFKCAAPDGSHYIVYVDAATGREAELLRLLEDENGTLTV